MSEKESEYAKAAREIIEKYDGDKEVMHVELDHLLLQALQDHGEEELVTVFDNVNKWYA